MKICMYQKIRVNSLKNDFRVNPCHKVGKISLNHTNTRAITP